MPTRAARFGFLVVMLALTAATKLGAQQLSDAAIVQQFFPQSLVDESQADFQKGGPEPFQFSEYIEADLDRTGTANYLAIGYSNGYSGVFRLIQKQAGGPVLVAEPSGLAMTGIMPMVKLIDVNGDGKPEILVGFSGPSNGALAEWLFQWTGGTLTSIGPTGVLPSGVQATYVGDVGFVDLDGDGILEMVSPPDPLTAGDIDSLNGATPATTYTVYKLSGGTYVATGTALNYFGAYVRQSGAPAVQTSAFAIDAPGASYVLTIANGFPPSPQSRYDTPSTSSPFGPATSADVYLNGVLVVGPSSFNPNVKVITVPVTLQATNTISVTLRGAPNTGFTIAIGKQQ